MHREAKSAGGGLVLALEDPVWSPHALRLYNLSQHEEHAWHFQECEFSLAREGKNEVQTEPETERGRRVTEGDGADGRHQGELKNTLNTISNVSTVQSAIKKTNLKLITLRLI